MLIVYSASATPYSQLDRVDQLHRLVCVFCLQSLRSWPLPFILQYHIWRISTHDVKKNALRTNYALSWLKTAVRQACTRSPWTNGRIYLIFRRWREKASVSLWLLFRIRNVWSAWHCHSASLSNEISAIVNSWSHSSIWILVPDLLRDMPSAFHSTATCASIQRLHFRLRITRFKI